MTGVTLMVMVMGLPTLVIIIMLLVSLTLIWPTKAGMMMKSGIEIGIGIKVVDVVTISTGK